MNFIFFLNNAFVKGFVSSATSLLSNNNNLPIKIYIVVDNLHQKNIKKITALLNSYQNCLYKILELNTVSNGEFDLDIFSCLPQYYRQSFYRLLPDLFCSINDDRVLYLDCDIIVTNKIDAFYNMDFKGKSLITISLDREGNNGGPYKCNPVPYNTIQIPLEASSLYFNSGVLLFNLEKIRKNHSVLYRKYKDAAINYRGLIKSADQDILNIVFENDKIDLVDRRYNLILPDYYNYQPGEFKWIKEEAKILHFVDIRKPWNYWNYSNKAFTLFNKHSSNNVIYRCFRYLVYFCFKKWPYWKYGCSFFGLIKKQFQKL